MAPQHIDPLADLYLDDSYFLGVTAVGTNLRFRVLFVLETDHPLYAPPKPGEQRCYREGDVVATRPHVLSWTAHRPVIMTDPDGTFDFGSIQISQKGSIVEVRTEWFSVTSESANVSVIFD